MKTIGLVDARRGVERLDILMFALIAGEALFGEIFLTLKIYNAALKFENEKLDY